MALRLLALLGAVEEGVGGRVVAVRDVGAQAAGVHDAIGHRSLLLERSSDRTSLVNCVDNRPRAGPEPHEVGDGRSGSRPEPNAIALLKLRNRLKACATPLERCAAPSRPHLVEWVRRRRHRLESTGGGGLVDSFLLLLNFVCS